jgi:hypothetical protein
MITYRSELHKIIDLSLPAAEIGVAEGLFSRDILTWGVVKLYMVDLWAHQPDVTGDGNSSQEWHEINYENAMRLVYPFGEKAVVLRGMSAEMASKVPDESLGFLYLDAAHDYDNVLKDLQHWVPKVVRGGVIAGHDYLNPAYGVKEAVMEFTKNKFKVQPIPDISTVHAGFWFKR